MDVNASYTFGKKVKMTFYAEANNLLNQPLRYYQGTKDRTMQAEYYGKNERSIDMGMDCRHWYGYLPECVCPDSARLERTGETTEFLYGQRFGT
eukprot:6732430-Prorocentrum_lima.AAC.1